MSKLAFVFPGQGSQHVGMARELYEKYGSAKKAFEQTNNRLKDNLSEIVFNGPEDKLTLTANAQPAILTASIAAWILVDEAGIKPDLVAGHSLGEYSAIVAAGGLSLEDAAYAVRRRGQFMQEAVPVGIGAMAAIIGLSMEQVEEICNKAAAGEVLSMANINSDSQIVIAGHKAAVDRAIEKAKEAGAKRAIPLQVSAPFHCELMKPAQDGMKNVLGEIDFRQLTCPLINNADVNELTSGEDVRNGLIKQVVAPVRWLETVKKMDDLGVETVVEIGPGKVLSGLIKRINRKIDLHNVEDSESLEKTIAALRG